MKTYLHTTLLALGLAAAAPFIQAQTPAPTPTQATSAGGSSKEETEAATAQAAELKRLGAQTEGKGKIGSNAEIDIPEGYIFFPSKGAKEIMKQWGNLVDGSEAGLIINDEKGWSVLFDFADDGYVKDDEKNTLDADKMLKAMHESEPEVNKALKAAGLPAQHITGFAMPPKYNETTNNLEWAIKFTTEGKEGETVNYRTKLLGRRGVMTATLMIEPEQLQAALPDYQKLLTGYSYVQGETYAEYRQGDKLATYGLTGLVLGGSAFAAAKMGLFAKLGAVLAKGGKAVIGGIVVVVAVIGKFFGKIFGRRDQSQFNQ
jgi:uncharacterized membrane-anchored protein